MASLPVIIVPPESGADSDPSRSGWGRVDGASVLALCSALAFLGGSVFLLARNWPLAIPLLLGAGVVVLVVIHVAGSFADDVAVGDVDALEAAMLHPRDYPSWSVTAIEDARPLLARARAAVLPLVRGAISASAILRTFAHPR